MIDDLLDHIVRGVRRALDDGHYDVPRSTEHHESFGGTDARPSLRAAVTRDAPEAFLAELKPASPSEGPLLDAEPRGRGNPSRDTSRDTSRDASRDPHDVALDRARIYRDHRVTGISVLTERDRFGGSPALLRDIAALPDAPPVLWKDFVIDPRQIDTAVACGASAILFIDHLFRRSLTNVDLPGMLAHAKEVGIEVLYEVDETTAFDHALGLDVDLIGINNRDLRTLEMDRDRTGDILRFRLDRLGNTPVLGLSGVEDRDDLLAMTGGGASGVLVGTSLMRAHDLGATIRKLRGTVHVKCCGTGHPGDDDAVTEALTRADAIGVVVAAGGARRERSVAQARTFLSGLPDHVERILVTTQDHPDEVAALMERVGATGIQWHREATPGSWDRLNALLPGDTTRIAVIRPTVDSLADAVELGRGLASRVDRILIDTPPSPGTDAGGTGHPLDLGMARRLVRELAPAKVVLAGGLDVHNVTEAIQTVRPWGIDVSSGLEEPHRHGHKDAERVARFIETARTTFGATDPRPPPRLPVMG